MNIAIVGTGRDSLLGNADNNIFELLEYYLDSTGDDCIYFIQNAGAGWDQVNVTDIEGIYAW